MLIQVCITSADHTSLSLEFTASLLRLRGHEPPAAVPLQDEVTGDILCFNGEIFGGLENMSPGQNDGLALLQALVNSSGIRLASLGPDQMHALTTIQYLCTIKCHDNSAYYIKSA